MYLDHFGLRSQPFSATPNTSFYVNLSGHEEAINLVLFALRSGEGFTKVVGEVGTGKTLLCRTILRRLGDGFVSAYIPSPALSPHDLQLALADELGIPVTADVNPQRLLRYLQQELINIKRSGRQTVLLIDEAQTIPDHTLESLRLLSNLELESSKLMQIVFFGQPEFDERLARHDMRQLQQRIAFSHRLQPIDRGATESYVFRRLVASGHSGERLFTPWALNGVHKASGGIPRLVNVICHKAMLSACASKDAMVGRKHVRQAVSDTEGIGRWRKIKLVGRRR